LLFYSSSVHFALITTVTFYSEGGRELLDMSPYHKSMHHGTEHYKVLIAVSKCQNHKSLDQSLASPIKQNLQMQDALGKNINSSVVSFNL